MAHDALPRVERIFYWVLGFSSIGYCLFFLWIESEKFGRDSVSGKDLLTPGWLLGRKQDLTDSEWLKWRSYVWKIQGLNVCHILTCLLCHRIRVPDQIRKMLTLMVDVAAISWFIGWRCTLLVAMEAAVMYLVTSTSSIRAVWIVTLALSTSLSLDWFDNKKAEILGFGNDEFVGYIFLVTEAFAVLSMASFAIEKVRFRSTNSKDMLTAKGATGCDMNDKESTSRKSDRIENSSQIIPADHTATNDDIRMKQRIKSVDLDRTEDKPADSDMSMGEMEIKDNVEGDSLDNPQHRSVQGSISVDPSFVDFLYYVLCLPKFFDGPIYTYDQFHEEQQQFYASPLHIPIQDITKNLFRIIFWAFFIDFQFHFFYFAAMTLDNDVMSEIPLTVVWAICYWQGQFFMVKYLCMYGLSMELLRFEGLTPHPWPRCISWVYSYADHWKHFDVGLYKLLKRYVFVPLGGSHSGIRRLVFASGVTFTFIFLYHGGNWKVFVWCLGNYTVGVMETLGVLVEKTSVGQFWVSLLGPAMHLRIKGLVTVPFYIASCCAISFFFFGATAGRIILDRVLFNASWTQMAAYILVFYVNIQNAMWIYRRHQIQQKCPRQRL